MLRARRADTLRGMSKPFRLQGETYPQADPFSQSYEDWQRAEKEREAKLGPEVAAAAERTREDYARDRGYDAPPVEMGGRYAVEAWRDNQRREAQLDSANGLPEDGIGGPKPMPAFPGRFR